MPKAAVIYRSERESYEADTCEPLVEAVDQGTVRLEALVRGHYPGRPLPPGALRGVQTIGFWDSNQQQEWGLPPHRNEGIELTFLERGNLAFGVREQSFDLQPGSLTITRPWQEHQVGNPYIASGRLHWVIIDVGVRSPEPTLEVAFVDPAQSIRLGGIHERPAAERTAGMEIINGNPKVL
jgi:AraC family L-rhamnose operon regulatory protein RhaS